MNANDDEFGTERLAASISENRYRSAQEIVDSVLAEGEEFSRGGSYVDDKVLVVLKVGNDGRMMTGKAY